MMSENIAQNMQSRQRIINYPTQLHLVGHFRMLYQDAREHEYQVYNKVIVQFFLLGEYIPASYSIVLTSHILFQR